jgi:PhnB protein
MPRVSTYINTLGRTEEAFRFYEEVFGTRITEIHRFGDTSDTAMPESERSAVLHVELPILAGHVLMGTDVLDSAGHTLVTGNNISINLEPDTRAEADRIHQLLSRGATFDTGLSDMPWGAYWANLIDRFGVQWQINTRAE